MRLIDRFSRRHADRGPTPAMRFVLGDRGEIHFPVDFLGWTNPSQARPPRGARPPEGLPPTRITGVDPASIPGAAESGELHDLTTLSGECVHEHHEHVACFAYDLAPVPTLTLRLGDTGGLALRFRGAVILDWTTAADYSPTHPNQELCDLNWDSGQHFLIWFLSFHIIIRSPELLIEGER